MPSLFKACVALAVFVVLAASSAQADESEELAKQLVNPVADLISVPFQGNCNDGIGPVEDGSR